MKIVKANEKVIFTATEKAILDRAFQILEDICIDCDDDDLYRYASDARNELECFLSDGANSFYEVEPPAEGVTEVIVKITI